MRILSTLAVAVAAAFASNACGRPAEAATAAAPVIPAVQTIAAAFVEHPDHIRPGGERPGPRLGSLTNPYEGSAQRISEGGKLFIAYNCMDCHGAEGAGAIGPSLQDGRWRFGGTAGEVFESIYQGRPDGMPAWGRRISDEDIWRLVSYVRTLEKGRSLSTENFTGKTVERSGR